MEKDIRKAWRALRGIVKDGCTFAEIKDLVGACGLPVEELSHLQQRSLPAKGASKSELLDAVDDLIKKEDEFSTKAIQHFLDDFLQRKRPLHDKVSECVQRFGWHLAEGVLQPDDLQAEEATRDLSADIRHKSRKEDLMGWNEVDDKVKKKLDRSFVSCDEEYELNVIEDVIEEEFPKIPNEEIVKAISRCCNKVSAPRPRQKFIQCVKNILS